MTRLVDDLLDLSRITRGQVVLQRERVDLADVVRRDRDERAGHRARRPHLTVRCRTAGHARCRRDPAGAGVLEPAEQRRQVQPTRRTIIESCGAADGDTVDVRVRDNGIGIPEELLPRVFEMFTQVDRAGAVGAGLGIGLDAGETTARPARAARSTAQSAGVGTGSEFRVTLPVVANVAPRAT